MRPRFTAISSRVSIPLALTILTTWSAWRHWQLLAASPFPLGVDGYFYPLQLRALLAHGHLAYPASPLAFYLLAPFAAATDPIVGAKLGAAVLGALIAWPAYGVGARLGGSRGAGLVAAVLATTSLGSAYLTVEFVKNSVGLTVGLAALWAVLAAIDPVRAPAGHVARRGAIIAGAIACAYATHKMAAAIVVLVAIPAVIAALTRRGALRGRRLFYVLGGLIVVAGVALAIGAAAPRRFLSPGDLALLDGLWSDEPAWTAPALVTADGALSGGHDALLGGVLAVIALVTAGLRVRLTAPGDQTVGAAAARIPAAGWPIVLLALAIGLPWLAVVDRQGLGFRLRLAAFVPMALTAEITARGLLAHYRHKERVLVGLAIALALVRAPTPDVLDGEVVTHPALVSAAQALVGHVPDGATLIVPERHIAFLAAWYTGAPIALRPELVPPEHRYRLLPLHFIGDGSPLDRALIAARDQPGLAAPLGLHPGHPNGLVLVAEPTWRWALAQLPAADRARYAAWPTL